MKVSILAILAAILAGCQMSAIQIGTPTPTAAPTLAPTVHPSRPRPTEAPTATATEAQTATISQAVVTVRRSAGGEPSGDYVYSGDRVELSGKCVKDWCPISKPVRGWIYQGCVSELAGSRRCEAR